MLIISVATDILEYLRCVKERVAWSESVGHLCNYLIMRDYNFAVDAEGHLLWRVRSEILYDTE